MISVLMQGIIDGHVKGKLLNTSVINAGDASQCVICLY